MCSSWTATCGLPPSRFWPTCVLHFFPGNPSAHARADSRLSLMQYPARAFRWSPDGKHAAAAGGKGERAVLIWDMATRAVVNSLSHHTAIISLSWSPAGTQIALVRAPSFPKRTDRTRLVLTHGAGSAVRGGQVLLMGRHQSGSAGQGPGALTAAAVAAIVVIVANRRRGGDRQYPAGRGATGRSR